MMDSLVYVSLMTAILALGLLELALLARMIVSLFTDPMSENRLGSILYAFTEPFIMPLRMLFSKLHWFENTPIDVSYIATSLTVAILVTLLSGLL